MPSIKQMVIAGVVALVIGITARAYKTGALTGTDAVVDITFSLECREVEGNWHESIKLPWNDAVTVVEREQADINAAKDRADALRRYYEWIKTTGVEYYDERVRLAFNHGIPDGNSTFAVDELRVVAATQERIDLRGPANGGHEEGYIDRRTGHGMITWYLPNPQGKDAYPREVVDKQFIFECKPSKPALF